MKTRFRSLGIHVLFLIYLAALLRITVFRTSALANGFFAGRFNLVPGVAYMQLLSWGSYFHAFYLFFGNIVWFVPLGLYARRLGLRFTSCLFCGAALSLLIEGVQYVLGCGVTETDDLLLNTCGAAIGALLCVLWETSRQ